MKTRSLAVVFLYLTVFLQTGFVNAAEASKKDEDDLSVRLMKSSVFAKVNLLDKQSNFVDHETSIKFKAAFPSQDLTGKPYRYMGLSVTADELKSMMGGGVINSPGALVDHPNEAVAMIYAQSQKKADTFPVILQVKAEDVQSQGQIAPASVTGMTLVYNDGFLADAKKTDPGVSPGDTYVGTPVLRLAAVPDDSAGRSISDVQGDLISTASGATRAVRAKEAPAPGHEEGVPEYTVKVLVGDSVVSVSGDSFKPFDLTGGEVNIAMITKDGVKTGSNPVLSTETLDNSSKFNVVILAISGNLVIDSPFFPEPLLLRPETNNYYTDDLGSASVGSQPEYQGRDESSVTPIYVGEGGERAKIGDGDGGSGGGDMAKTLDENPSPAGGA